MEAFMYYLIVGLWVGYCIFKVFSGPNIFRAVMTLMLTCFFISIFVYALGSVRGAGYVMLAGVIPSAIRITTDRISRIAG
jgi:hypothetical protein